MNELRAPNNHQPGRASILLAVVWAALATTTAAAEYPARPIRFIVPQAPGGASDVNARLLVTELPTISEAGVPGFEVITWGGVMVPAGVPKAIVAKLNAAINKALASPVLKEKFAVIGYEPVGGTPEQFDAFIKKEIAKWSDVIRRSGVKVD